MSFIETAIQGSWVFEPRVWSDSRGQFYEAFKLTEIQQSLGINFDVKQANVSRSRAGVLRGVHWSVGEHAQAKYVSCVNGRVLDFVVDVRVDSPTFGKWDCFELSPVNGRAMLISKGLGHAFLALEDDSIVSYLCSEEYDPASERSINPISVFSTEEIFELNLTKVILSNKDSDSPGILSLLE
jgi:dTDP-4-dehydrorhamnose 3,5-epimerase